jgi:hypothetical protein
MVWKKHLDSSAITRFDFALNLYFFIVQIS